MPNIKFPVIMGILNLTPDSFSDGGQLSSTEKLLQTAESMLQNGATILDLGAEASGSTSKDVSLEEELHRLTPALKAITTLKTKYNFQISIDTYKAKVADFCLQNGADIINDITAFRGDPEILAVLSKSSCPIVIMYSKDDTARTSLEEMQYSNVTDHIIKFFQAKIALAEEHGISKSRLILDPGMGAFISTDITYSYQLLNNLPKIKKHFNLPILIGTSRKSMHPFPLKDRLVPSIITAMKGIQNGADVIRVHDVKEHYLAMQTISLINSNL